MQPIVPAHFPVLSAMHRIGFSHDPWDEKAMAEVLAMPGCFGFLLDERDPRGFIICRTAADEAEVLSLLVLPACRRQGLASLLLKESIATCGALGCQDMFLEVAVDNLVAQALYLSHGFENVGRRPQYYADGRDAFVMKCPL